MKFKKKKKKILDSHGVQSQIAHFPLTEPSAAVGTKSDFIVGSIIAKSPRFFIRQSCHKHLLQTELLDKTITGTHCMINANAVFVNLTIDDFSERVNGDIVCALKYIS
jgi:hypothetical protein